MTFYLKSWIQGFRKPEKEQSFNVQSPESDIMKDDERLEDQVPYKLEPDLSDIEDYLGRIRRGGL